MRAYTRARPVRAPLPPHLPRERVVLPSPARCPDVLARIADLPASRMHELLPWHWSGRSEDHILGMTAAALCGRPAACVSA